MALDAIKKNLIDPLARRVMLMFARSIVNTINDNPSNGLQLMQVSILENETRESLERFQNFGFSSNPMPGAEAAVAFVGGNRDHGIIVAVDDRRYRPKGLQPGEAIVYTHDGTKIHLKQNGIIQINADDRVVIETDGGYVDILGDLIVHGDIDATGDIKDKTSGDGRTMASMRTIYNAHTHVETGGTTNAPGGTM